MLVIAIFRERGLPGEVVEIPMMFGCREGVEFVCEIVVGGEL
jgi:hypothetical protein